MEITQINIRKIKNIFSSFRITSKKKAFIIFIAVFATCILATGSALAYSIKLKSDGDNEYKNKNYNSSLLKYKDAQQWWIPERISFKLRDRDLHNKLNKSEIMVKSGNNYTKGLDAFNNKKYPEAENYLTNIVINDSHYQEAQQMIKDIQKKTEIALIITATPSKISLTPITRQISPTSNTPTSLPTIITAPATTQNLTKTPKDLMPDKPVIDSFCDNKGNCVHSQFADPNSSSSLPTYPTVRVGETLNFVIKVSGEDVLGALAFIISQGYDGGNLGRKPWSTDLTYTKNFSKEDVSTSGYPIYAYIKSQNDNYHRRPVCNWTDYPCDDSATLYYNVLP